eukprot:jgi/Mesvir1/22050/Mv12705-RA.1
MSAALLLLPLGVALGAGGWYLYKVAEEREAEVGECKEAKWKEQICLGSRWYVGESVTKDKIPAIPKEEAAKVLTKLNGGPFQLAFEFKDEELPKWYVLESDGGFIMAEDAARAEKSDAMPEAREKEVVTALDDGYFSKKWLQAIKPESRSGRFADRFPTRTLKHTVFDGGSWGITVVKEADASTKTFAYAFWTAPSDL